MNKEQQKKNREKWVAALRSGEYKQTHGVLKNSDNRYCCLGVACEIFSKENEGGFEYIHGEFYFKSGDEERVGSPPTNVVKYFGLISEFGIWGEGDGESLVGMNDNGKSFEEIAQIIEEEPEGLFE